MSVNLGARNVSNLGAVVRYPQLKKIKGMTTITEESEITFSIY